MGVLGALAPDHSHGAALPVSAQAAEKTPAIPARDGEAVGGPFAVAPAFLPYVQAHGGVDTVGAPLSEDFPLLGKRVQVFERQVLEVRADRSVGVLDLLDDGLPLIHVAGQVLPGSDSALAATLPVPGTADYINEALALISAGLLDQTAPDQWNGLPVNFGSTFRSTVPCADQAPDGVCDEVALLRAALEFWGLPTSWPVTDPLNPDLTYVRFQRGILQFSASEETTRPVPLGAWFKRILLGIELPGDLLTDVAGSRYYAQYAPDLPLALARPNELPATSLATAFGTRQGTAGLRQTGNRTPPALAPAIPEFGVAPQPTAPTPIWTPTPVGTPPAGADPLGATVLQTQTALPTQTATTSSAAQGPDPCAGDEQLLFAPKKPYAGTEVLVAATSGRRHDARSVRLAGPIKTGQPTERQGLSGWVWEWVITPPQEGWYAFEFYVDGARLCASSGFNALSTFGASPTATLSAPATPIPTPTAFPSATLTPTATPFPPPVLTSVTPESGGCNDVLFLNGANFGYPQAEVGGQVFFVGPGGTRPAPVLGWGATQVTVSAPTSSLAGGVYNVIVQAHGIASNRKPYTLLGTCS
jgi:hypothetical protein